MEGVVAFAAALGLVFVMELGDKTQLALVSLSARHPWKPVLAGGAAGLGAATAVGAVVGAAVSVYLSESLLYVKLAGAALFVALGVRELMVREEPDDEEEPGRSGASAGATAFLLTFLAEMGDKTQLTVIVLASGESAPISVFAGASVALVLMAAISVLVGTQLARRLREETLRRLSAALFIGAGLLIAAEALLGG